MLSTKSSSPFSKTVRLRQVFNAPMELVFAHLSDPNKYGGWMGTKVERISASPVDSANPDAVGAVRKVSLGPFQMEQTITLHRPPHCLEYRITKGSPVTAHVGTITLNPRSEGCELYWNIHFHPRVPGTGHFWSGMIRRVYKSRLKKLAASLSDQSWPLTYPVVINLRRLTLLLQGLAGAKLITKIDLKFNLIINISTNEFELWKKMSVQLSFPVSYPCVC